MVRAVDWVQRRWLVGRVAIVLRLAWHWQTAGDLNEAARHAERALRLARGRPAMPATLVAEVALTLARIAHDRDDIVDCGAHLEHAVSVLQMAPEGTDRDRLLGWALVGLGDQRRRAGDHPAARQVLARALQLVESAEPPDPRLRAAVLTSRGITAKELGAFHTAARCYARVWCIHREAGATRADAAALQHNLAGLQYSRRRYPQAEAHARQALALRRQASRVTPVELGADLAVLASTLAAQHRHDEARTLLRQALAAYQTARPPCRYEIAVQLHNLADVEHAVGRFADAEDLYRQALSLKEELLGTDHPEIGLVANNLATLLMEQGRTHEAADWYRRALSITERACESSHPLIDRIHHNLGRLEPIGLRGVEASQQPPQCG